MKNVHDRVMDSDTAKKSMDKKNDDRFAKDVEDSAKFGFAIGRQQRDVNNVAAKGFGGDQFVGAVADK